MTIADHEVRQKIREEMSNCELLPFHEISLVMSVLDKKRHFCEMTAKTCLKSEIVLNELVSYEKCY